MGGITGGPGMCPNGPSGSATRAGVLVGKGAAMLLLISKTKVKRTDFIVKVGCKNRLSGILSKTERLYVGLLGSQE